MHSERAALREDAELAEALRRSEVDAEEALARRVSRCEEAVSSESTGGGGDLLRRVERLEASLGAATEGSLEERVGAIERLIGPEAAEAAEQHLRSHLCVCGPCSELLRECPYCREPVMMWLAPRPVCDVCFREVSSVRVCCENVPEFI
mmetsp:Transcript_4892/g.14316  ORF Transcript_4892/g.14316 Transcript_4892/m.14316 type:complete len:149 (+) Transcript_4892:960-1406(+)